jgi:hypothetical protein
VEVDEDKLSEASRSPDKIPPPDPAFMRSLALLHQINLLEDPSNCDYVVMSFSLQISDELTDPECLKLMFPEQQPDMGVVFPSKCPYW